MEFDKPTDGESPTGLSDEEAVARHRVELHRAEQELGVFRDEFLKRRIVRWTIRWVIGFASIGVVVYFNRDWTWLWWAGAVFASIMPVMAFVWIYILHIKTARARAALAAMEIALAEAGEN